MRRRTHNRRGVTAVMAMLYLVLFSTLAIGFYAAVTTAVQVSSNEKRSIEARLAAESGLEFMKYTLGTLGIPAATPADQIWAEAYNRLDAKFTAMANLSAAQRSVGLSADGATISIPEDPNVWIDLDTAGNAGFRAQIWRKHDNNGADLNGEVIRVTIFGKYGDAIVSTRGVQIDFNNAPNESRIFDFGVATPGKVQMNGNTKIIGAPGQSESGSVLTTYTGASALDYALVMEGEAQISGMAFFTNPNAAMSISSSATLGDPPTHPYESGFSDLIEKGIDSPEFPVVDTSAFKPYATTAYDDATMKKDAVLTNVYIPANTNPTITNGTIQGVLYVYQPNIVKFSGNLTMKGTIVVDNEDHGTPSSNTMTFNSITTAPMPDTIDAGLRALGGSFLLAENFTANFGGNFSTVNGSIIASGINFSGTAGGTVKGSVIALGTDPVNIKGSTTIEIESQGAENRPAGLFFGSHYEPVPDTFKEIIP